MKRIRRDDIDYLKSCPVGAVRVFVEDRLEHFLVVCEEDSNEIVLSCVRELGDAPVSFLYDPVFEGVIGFLQESDGILSEIKSGNSSDEQWAYFNRFLLNLFHDGTIHPFYYPVYVEIVSAYRRGMRDANGELLPDDYFQRLGHELIEVKQKISNLLREHDSAVETTDAMECYRNKAFYEPLPVHNLQVEMKSTGELRFTLVPSKLEEMWNYLLVCYTTAGIRFKRCDNCKRFFATTGRGNPKFCDRIIEGMGKSCRQVMPKLNFNSKAEKDPAVWLYNRAYKTMYSRIGGGNWTKEMFKGWAVRARVKRDECSWGEISAEEFSAWLSSNGLFIDYLKES